MAFRSLPRGASCLLGGSLLDASQKGGRSGVVYLPCFRHNNCAKFNTLYHSAASLAAFLSLRCTERISAWVHTPTVLLLLGLRALVIQMYIRRSVCVYTNVEGILALLPSAMR